MSIQSAVFNGRAALSAGIALSYARPYATVNLAGTAIAIGSPYYEQPCVYVAPPASVTTISTTTNTSGQNNLHGSGTWTAGEAATIQHFSAGGSNVTGRYVKIRVNEALTAGAWDTFTGARCVDIGKSDGATNGPDLLANTTAGSFGESGAVYRHLPKNGVIHQGLAMIVGSVTRAATSWSKHGGIFIAYWDDTALMWKSAYSGPQYDEENAPGGQDWPRPKVCFLDTPSTATEAFVVWPDYMTTTVANTTGTKCAGTVGLARIYRTSATSTDWALDQVVELVRPTYDVLSAGGNVGTHVHDAVVLPWGSGGMVVVVTVGHSTTQTTQYFTRADRLYATGFVATGAAQTRSTPTGGASTPINPTSVTPCASTTDGATLNGWTTTLTGFGDLTTTPVLTSNQAMSFDRVSDSTKWLATSDEAFGPFQLGTLPSAAGRPITYNRCIDGGTPSFPGVGIATHATWQAWGISRPDPAVYANYLAPRMVDNISGSITTPNLGTAWSSRFQAGKFMFSPDGTYWGAMYAPGTTPPSRSFVAGWHGSTAILGVTNGASNIQLRAVPLPSYAVRSPLVVSPASVNYARNPAKWGNAGGSNTLTDVTSTYTTLITGRTIPTCPTNSNVMRLTGVNSGGSSVITTELRPEGSGTNGVAGGTGAMPIASKYVKMRVWVYRLPVADSAYSNNTAPFNSSNGPYIQLRCANDDAAKVAAATYANGRMDSSGWYSYECDVDVTSATDLPTTVTSGVPNGAYRCYLRISSASSTATPADFLISCECLNAGTTVDWPTVPPPCAAGSTTTTLADACSVDGFTPGADWSFITNLQLSPRGWDAYVTDARRPASRRLFTLWESPTKYIAVSYDTVNARYSITNGSTTLTLSAVSTEVFEPQRLDNLTLGISVVGSTGVVVLNGAVGGTQINTATATNAAWSIRPSRVIYADANLAPTDGVMIHGAWMNNATAIDSSGLSSAMTSGNTLAGPVTPRRLVPMIISS